MNAPATAPTTQSTPSAPSAPIDGVFEAIASPARRSILDALRDGDRRTVSEIAEACDDLSRSTISRHLRVLRDADLVNATQVGRAWDYSIRTEPLNEVYRSWLAAYVRPHEALDASSERDDRHRDAELVDAEPMGDLPRSPEDIVERISRRLDSIPTGGRLPRFDQRSQSAPARPARDTLLRSGSRLERSER